MKNKDTVLIIYPGGGYGTFFEWCLSYFSGELTSSESPLVAGTGSAHNFVGNPLDFPKDLWPGSVFLTVEEYLSSDFTYTFVRSHGEDGNGTVQKYVDRYGHYFKKIIHLRHENKIALEVLSNSIYKIKKINVADFWYDNAKVVSSDAIWEIREKLSFVMEGRYKHHDKEWTDFVAPNVIDVPIAKLGTDFEQVLENVFSELGLIFDPTRKKEMPEHLSTWRTSQQFLHIDQKCSQIINSTVNNRYHDWSHIHLDIFAEAYIQMQFRLLHKLQLKCYNLNVFPTNTKDLKELLLDV
jgi:hypothetical protein